MFKQFARALKHIGYIASFFADVPPLLTWLYHQGQWIVGDDDERADRIVGVVMRAGLGYSAHLDHHQDTADSVTKAQVCALEVDLLAPSLPEQVAGAVADRPTARPGHSGPKVFGIPSVCRYVSVGSG